MQMNHYGPHLSFLSRKHSHIFFVEDGIEPRLVYVIHVEKASLERFGMIAVDLIQDKAQYLPLEVLRKARSGLWVAEPLLLPLPLARCDASSSQSQGPHSGSLNEKLVQS